MKIEFYGSALVADGKRFAPDVRTFSQMRPVLAFPQKDCGLEPDEGLYYMYRGVREFGPIRYDVTKIISTNLCGERNKTYGHAHPPSPKGACWPEIYEVLSGSSHTLLQKIGRLGVEDAALVVGKKGDCILIPPGYGHVTINAGKTDLVLSNLVSSRFSSDYSPYTHRRGACFYETIDGKIIRNKSYGLDFELRQVAAPKFSSSFGCFSPFKKGGLLQAAKDYRNIEFLDKPEEFY